MGLSKQTKHQISKPEKMFAVPVRPLASNVPGPRGLSKFGTSPPNEERPASRPDHGLDLVLSSFHLVLSVLSLSPFSPLNPQQCLLMSHVMPLLRQDGCLLLLSLCGWVVDRPRISSQPVSARGPLTSTNDLEIPGQWGPPICSAGSAEPLLARNLEVTRSILRLGQASTEQPQHT